MGRIMSKVTPDSNTPNTPPASSGNPPPAEAADAKRRAALAKAAKCKPEEVLSWRDYPERSVVVVVVCTEKFAGKVELPL